MRIHHRPTRSGARIPLTLLLVAALTSGCANPEESGPGETPPPEDTIPAPEPGAAEAEVHTVDPPSGEPSSQVSLRGRGFEPGSLVNVGFGPPQSEFEVIAQVDANEDGTVASLVTVPPAAERGRRYVFVLSAAEGETRAVASFHVTTQQGRVRVEGRITDEGVECVAMRGPLDELYTLVGDVDELEPGDQVTVEGQIAEMSICMQGTTLEVSSVERN